MQHVFRTEMAVPRPGEEVFAFFADAGNLERITPGELRFRILTPLPIVMRSGTLIDYELGLLGVRFRWKTEITSWDPPREFTDVQRRGPYREWIHTHRFRSVPGGTEIHDEVRFRLPLEPLGDLASRLVRIQVARIFGYRRKRLGELLGTM